MTLLDTVKTTYAARVTPVPARVKSVSMLGLVLGVVAALLVRGWRITRPLLLGVTGLGLMVAAAFTISLAWGLLAAGAAALFLEWRIHG